MYQCSGKFIEDFLNLCKQDELSFVPLVISRTKLPNSPTQIDSKEKPKLVKKASGSVQYESSMSTAKPQLSYEYTILDGGIIKFNDYQIEDFK